MPVAYEMGMIADQEETVMAVDNERQLHGETHSLAQLVQPLRDNRFEHKTCKTA